MRVFFQPLAIADIPRPARGRKAQRIEKAENEKPHQEAAEMRFPCNLLRAKCAAKRRGTKEKIHPHPHDHEDERAPVAQRPEYAGPPARGIGISCASPAQRAERPAGKKHETRRSPHQPGDRSRSSHHGYVRSRIKIDMKEGARRAAKKIEKEET